MALNIKSPEADRLARELSRRRQKPVPTVIFEALRAELAREAARLRPRGMADRVMAIGAHCALLPVLDDRSDEELLGHDDAGVG